jgi:hypothetical protein
VPSEGPEAYYLPRGNGRYEPTWATESPWDRKAQHGGPPAALLAHVIDQAVEGPLRISRISVDILGPIPLREAVVEVSPVKPGRRVQLTEARMMVDVTARTWHIATGDRPPTTGEEQTAPTCSTRTGSSVRSPSPWLCRSASQTTVPPDRVKTPVCVGHCSRVQSELANGHPLDLGSAG